MGSGNLVKIVNNSFGAWTEAITSGGRVAPVISNGGITTINRARFDGQNVITWGRTSGTALGVTYIWYYTTTYKVAEVDTVMNQKFSWAWSDPSTWPSDPQNDTCAYANVYDAQNIMVHEIGHWYGLDDEYDAASYAHNTMYGYGSKKETKKDTLTTGDITGINKIY